MHDTQGCSECMGACTVLGCSEYAACMAHWGSQCLGHAWCTGVLGVCAVVVHSVWHVPVHGVHSLYDAHSAQGVRCAWGKWPRGDVGHRMESVCSAFIEYHAQHCSHDQFTAFTPQALEIIASNARGRKGGGSPEHVGKHIWSKSSCEGGVTVRAGEEQEQKGTLHMGCGAESRAVP